MGVKAVSYETQARRKSGPFLYSAYPGERGGGTETASFGGTSVRCATLSGREKEAILQSGGAGEGKENSDLHRCNIYKTAYYPVYKGEEAKSGKEDSVGLMKRVEKKGLYADLALEVSSAGNALREGGKGGRLESSPRRGPIEDLLKETRPPPRDGTGGPWRRGKWKTALGPVY